jgi:DNA processing protein
MSIDAVNIIALMAIRGVGPAKVRKLYGVATRLQEAGGGRKESFDLALHSTLLPDQTSLFANHQERADEELAALRDHGITVLTFLDDAYPRGLREKLGNDSPSILFCKGNLGLLDAPAVGFCGSRQASEKGLAATWDSATGLARAHINVVSGYASGVDMTAHSGALKAGGTTTVVLAEGLKHFRIKRDIRPLWDESRVLVVSEFGMGMPWSVSHAMQRNKTICALSQALILVEAKETGGSIEAGKECLKLGMPLFAAVYQGSPESARGNEAVLGIGAIPLMKNSRTNLPNIKPVLETLTAIL